MGTAPLEVTDLSTLPALILPADLWIPDLPGDLQPTADRVQLMFDSDGDSETITLDDIDDARGLKKVFLPAEIEDLTEIERLFTGEAETTADARIAVPAPGAEVATVTMGPVTFEEKLVMSYDEVYRYTHRGSAHWSHSLRGTRQLNRTIDGGTATVLVADAIGGWQVHRGPTDPRVREGDHLVEVWQDGIRLWSAFVVMPDFTSSTEYLDLDEYRGYDLEADGPQLERNVSTAYTDNSYYRANYTWDATPLAPTGPVDQGAEAAAGEPWLSLAPGRYEAILRTGQVLTVDVYPQGGAEGWHR